MTLNAVGLEDRVCLSVLVREGIPGKLVVFQKFLFGHWLLHFLMLMSKPYGMQKVYLVSRKTKTLVLTA